MYCWAYLLGDRLRKRLTHGGQVLLGGIEVRYFFCDGTCSLVDAAAASEAGCTVLREMEWGGSEGFC